LGYCLFTLGLLAISYENSTSSESSNSYARDADDKHTSVHEFLLLDMDKSATMAKKETSDMMGIGIPRNIISLDVQDGPFSVQGTIGSGIRPT